MEAIQGIQTLGEAISAQVRDGGIIRQLLSEKCLVCQCTSVSMASLGQGRVAGYLSSNHLDMVMFDAYDPKLP